MRISRESDSQGSCFTQTEAGLSIATQTEYISPGSTHSSAQQCFGTLKTGQLGLCIFNQGSLLFSLFIQMSQKMLAGGGNGQRDEDYDAELGVV